MTFTASIRYLDNFQAVRNLLHSGVEPMMAVRAVAPHLTDDFDHNLQNLAKMRRDLAWMLDQTDGAIASLEATQAAALTPDQREAKVALVAEAQEARVVSSGPADTDFHSSAAA